MITFTQQAERVTLEMSSDDFERLLMMIGVAGGAAMADGNIALFWSWIQFANEINATNPNFTQYEIPAEHAPKGKPQ